MSEVNKALHIRADGLVQFRKNTGEKSNMVPFA